MTTCRRRLCGLTLALFALPAAVWAQGTWPAKAITMINPHAAGAGVDPVARLVAQKLGERLGQQVVVENRTGAAGMVGTGSVAKARPDGYTLLMSAAGEIVVNQHIYPSVPYDAEKDLAPVSVVVKLPMVLVAHPTAPYNTLQEMIAYARQNPGKLNYASGGSGSIQHLAAELLKSVAGVPIVHIPYRGVALAITDVLANQVPVMFAGFPTALQHVKSGKLKALGVTSTARMAQAPTLPTIAEQGYAGYEVVQWFGLFAPAGTPGELVSRLNADLRAVLAMPDVAANLNGQGATPSPTSPDDFSKFIKAESAKYGLLVKATGIKAD